MKLDFDAIIITSDEPYSKMWHTQLIYTEYLSKSNIVFFINPPKKWSLKNVFTLKLLEFNKVDNLTVINYNNILPSFIKTFNLFNEQVNEKNIAKELNKIKASKLLIWHFDSFKNAFFNNFYSKTIIIKRLYHVIDPFYNNPLDKLLCELANLIIITSPRLNNYYKNYENKIINIPQCLDIELQHKLINVKSNVKLKIKGNYFVLLGTISDDIDFNWILELLKIPNFKLVIIGKKINIVKSINQSQIVFNHANVEYLGVLSPQEFYPIVKNALGGLILYSEEKTKQPRSPLKALNYLIAGIPTITNIDCEITQLLGSCIYYVQNTNEISDFINKAIYKEINFNFDQAKGYLQTVSIKNVIKSLIQKL